MAFGSVEQLRAAAGSVLGHSEWVTVDQRRIDQFADATGDHQWIHIDPERAAQGPFGTTVAHGMLTLSLLPAFVEGMLHIEGARMGVNYGLNKVRFPGLVPAGSRLRGMVELLEVTDVDEAVQVVYRVTVEREGGDRPVCVAEAVARIYF